ncbi:hypothetical protein [Vibrio parahaemolyticus]|uniref:hypothetical protein n=1 Tax=Vibrio parahaemolyticus TaxID=670 RepID=UPI00081345D4|nr:hypothetical protein [Vibrio parahaemolyticus]OCP85898.1 hypothetical protein AKH13_22675 [Vibrio parahaemolyticus]OCP95379.1 hypothetical protein AKH14_19510 [Vibrio parahaemolyticus]
MNNLTYISGWESELCIQLETEHNHRADFNRFLVKDFPTTKKLQMGGSFENANREGFILQLHSRFIEAIEEGASHATLHSHFCGASQYLRWCDNEEVEAFTQTSLEGYMSHLQYRVMQGRLKEGTYSLKRSALSVVLTQYLDLPNSYFDHVIVMGKSDTEPFEAYSRSDLNQLLPFLRRLFNQTYEQFIEDPDKHINAHRNAVTMTFTWQGKKYPLHASITKMMCAATYLLSYYTYSNTSDLLGLRRPQNASTSAGEVWYTMPSFKRRAFKTIQVEMGEHQILEIPKYSMTFFDKLLNASRRINAEEGAYLFQAIGNQKKVTPLRSVTLQGFLRHWVEKHFNFTDQTGRKLRPVISRFRETGSQLTAYHQGEIVNDIMLDNTPNTRKRHYSEGNKQANKGMMQDTMSIRQEQIQSGVSTKQARKNLDIDVLVIEEENKINFPDLSRTPNGGSCSDPFGEKSEKYTKKAQTQGLASAGERLACADLLECFGCSDQVIVQSVSDIWCLLSFKACIEDSLYLHLDANHYRKNFEDVVQFIEQKILPSINRRILKQAETKLDDDGLHPAWDDSESVLGLIPQSTDEAKNGHL